MKKRKFLVLFLQIFILSCSVIFFEACANKTHSHLCLDDWLKDESNHWKVCSECGAEINKEEHDYIIEMKSETQHRKECCCGEKTGEEEHIYDQKKVAEKYFAVAATTTEREKYYYSCVCGEKGEETFEIGCPLYHFINEKGECVYCHGTEYSCSHATLKEFLLSDNSPIERCGLFQCDECNKTFYKSIDYSDLGIPIVCLDGNIAEATKTNKVEINFSYYGEKNFEETGTVKWQGSTSINFSKKNYTLKLDSKLKINESWGKQKKYCLKANYVDFSQARNVVSAKIYGEIVQSRNLQDEISSLVNGGAIDGFPVVVFNNGNHVGLYTFNIPKDKWLFGMSDSDEKNQAILMGDDWTLSTKLYEPINEDFSNGWDLEYYSNEESEIDNDSKWVVDSFNAMMTFLSDNDGQDFKDGIGDYINVERSIDAMLYTYALCAQDNVSKNILWITYDGKIWQPSVYDMDDTWGMVWNGIDWYSHEAMLFSRHDQNLLWTRLFDNYTEEIAERWQELRKDVLTTENVEKAFSAFFDKIPSLVYDTEKIKWTEVPSQEINNLQQITDWCEKRLVALDNDLSTLTGES